MSQYLMGHNIQSLCIAGYTAMMSDKVYTKVIRILKATTLTFDANNFCVRRDLLPYES